METIKEFADKLAGTKYCRECGEELTKIEGKYNYNMCGPCINAIIASEHEGREYDGN